MNDFSLSLLENIQLLLMSSSKETASELDTFFMEKLLLFYALAIELHLLQLSVFVFDDMYIMLLVLQAIAVHQKLVPSLYVMYIATP
jgi:hypothetical protein